MSRKWCRLLDAVADDRDSTRLLHHEQTLAAVASVGYEHRLVEPTQQRLELNGRRRCELCGGLVVADKGEQKAEDNDGEQHNPTVWHWWIQPSRW